MLDFEGVMVVIRGQRTGETAAHRQGLQWGIDHFGFGVRGDMDAYCVELKRKGGWCSRSTPSISGPACASLSCRPRTGSSSNCFRDGRPAEAALPQVEERIVAAGSTGGSWPMPIYKSLPGQ
jgi:hypothetical protein